MRAEVRLTPKMPRRDNAAGSKSRKPAFIVPRSKLGPINPGSFGRVTGVVRRWRKNGSTLPGTC